MSITSIKVRVAGAESAKQTFTGRAAWALSNLITAGENGCTPINQPAPRWNHYTWVLRRAGLNVETITECHGGAYAGHHARYLLRSHVEVVEIEMAGGR